MAGISESAITAATDGVLAMGGACPVTEGLETGAAATDDGRLIGAAATDDGRLIGAAATDEGVDIGAAATDEGVDIGATPIAAAIDADDIGGRGAGWATARTPDGVEAMAEGPL
ncbi:MAG: hypothetical protein Q8N26_14425 [Myxococcales bacterium]|nr:hypothetical protein [Myxococcales bacterium]